MKIYWRWCGEVKYEFYIDTGEHRHNTPVTRMITINIIYRKVATWKRGRLKKLLLSPPKEAVIGVGDTLCILEKVHELSINRRELIKIFNLYKIKENINKIYIINNNKT